MRKSKLFFGAFLSFSLAVGVGVGLGVNKEAKEVKADGASHTVYCAIDNTTLGDYTLKLNVQLGSIEWSQQNMVQVADDSAYPNSSIFTATFNDQFGGIKKLQFQLYSGEAYVEQDEVVNVDWDTEFAFDNKIHVYGQSGWSIDAYTPVSPLQYVTVTKLAVEFVDGVAQAPADWGLGQESILKGSAYSIPSKTDFNMEHFGGWYSDASCTVSFSGSDSVSADLTIYAKYTKLEDDSYIYWVSESTSPVFNRVHFWGEKSPASDPELSAYDVTGVVTFNGLSQKVYKIPVPSTGDVSFLLHNEDYSKQTYDINVTPGTAYYTWQEYGQSKYSWNANDDAARALDLIFAVEAKRNAVSEHGDIKAYSVCGISTSDSLALYNEYLGLSAASKGMVDNSSTKTYNPSNPSEEIDHVSYYNIMQQLGIQGGAINSSRFGSLDSLDTDSNNTMIIVVSSIAASTAIALGVLLVLKKRKHQ